LFGVGMILARRCASRLLVLATTGNLRALLLGLVFAVAAQAALHEILSPARNWLAGSGAINRATFLVTFGVDNWAGLMFGLAWVAAICFGRRAKVKFWGWTGGVLCGISVALGWLLTQQLSLNSFNFVPVGSLTFSGPSADTLMRFLSPPGDPFDFDIGVITGAFGGSFMAALLAG
jgi:uncharacterized membrane protein YedE/YeeE